MKYEVSEQWDKAAEEFALAVSENPRILNTVCI
jgi:hypothetical protein